MRAVAGVVLVIAALAGAGTASAATIGFAGPLPALTYTAGPNETNRLTVTGSIDPVSGGPLVTFHDKGNLILPDSASNMAYLCTFAGDTATCQGDASEWDINLGSGNDSAFFDPATARHSWPINFLRIFVDGGAGSDSLSGDWSDYSSLFLNGGADDDLLEGGRDWTRLNGGPGADVMRPLPGNSGRPEVSYEDSPARVRVTLDGVANDGTPGEHDNVAPDIGNVTGSQFDDTLSVANGASQFVYCGDGDDSVIVDAVDAIWHDCESSRVS
jgi:hypothetical protein